MRILSFLVFLVAGCQSGLQTHVEAASGKPGDAVSVEALVKSPERWEGVRLAVTGNFMGWDGRCKGAPPLTKSDWMLEKDGACIYVSGRLPAGMSAAPPKKGVGDSISISAFLERDPQGRYFLRVPRD